VTYWEIIADNLSKSGWSWAVSQRLIPTANDWIADAHRDNGKRFVARAEEKLTAFLELESAISKAGKLAALHGLGVSVISELAFLSRDYRPNKNKLSYGSRSRASNTVEGL
jgi:hypothetical protein